MPPMVRRIESTKRTTRRHPLKNLIFDFTCGDDESDSIVVGEIFACVVNSIGDIFTGASNDNVGPISGADDNIYRCIHTGKRLFDSAK